MKINPNDIIHYLGRRYVYVSHDDKQVLLSEYYDRKIFEEVDIRDIKDLEFNWYDNLHEKIYKFKYFHVDMAKNIVASNIAKKDYIKTHKKIGEKAYQKEIFIFTDLIPEKLFNFFYETMQLWIFETDILMRDFNKIIRMAVKLEIINIDEVNYKEPVEF
jgi:hypothetical protein